MNTKSRKSPRLASWDYGTEASYFITICTKNREHFFGKIINKKMQLSQAGAIASVFWFEIKNHAKNIDLGEFVVMPNHIHGILILKGNEDDNDVGTTQNPNIDDVVGTTHALSLPSKTALSLPPPNRFQNQGKNTVSSIVGSYKSAVTKYCNLLEFPMGWQSRFFDHIIRNEDSFHRISQYIQNNPANWLEDKFY
ncbi:transposase [Algoriphagus sp.]|uniref:transposase n=1 Tax=Algoriphagus sp. TaxID=1872435 RepID=UPI0025D7B27E|nr:transposase [Algoriphagus sp.]